MKQPNTADAVHNRLIALSYMQAIISADHDFAEMVTSTVNTKELLQSMESLSMGLISIISSKTNLTKEEVVESLRKSSLDALRATEG